MSAIVDRRSAADSPDEDQSAAERRATADAEMGAAPSAIAESLADLLEAVVAAGRPFSAPGTDSAPPAPPARIQMDRDDRRLLILAHNRVLHGDLSIPAAEPLLASLVRALAQVLLDQDAIA